MEAEIAVIKSEQWEQNFNDWNDIQNCFNLKCVNNNVKCPKWLIKAATREFNDIAKTYHIDTSFYKWLRISTNGITWQFDFHCDEDSTGACVSIYDVYISRDRKRINQRAYSI